MNGLSTTQLARLKKALAVRYDALIEEVRAASEQTQNWQYPELLGNDPPDDADASTARALVDVNLAMADRDVQEIRDIEAARSRIEEGTYGICAECGTRIPIERLIAYPTAKRCFACQSVMEKTHAPGGTSSL